MKCVKNVKHVKHKGLHRELQFHTRAVQSRGENQFWTFGPSLFEYLHDGLTWEKSCGNEKVLFPHMTMGSFIEEKNYLARFGRATVKNIILGVPIFSQKLSKMNSWGSKSDFMASNKLDTKVSNVEMVLWVLYLTLQFYQFFTKV